MSQNKQVAKNIIYNSLVFVIGVCVNFVLTPYLIKHVGKEAYSFFPLVNNVIGYTSIITTAVGSMGGRFMTMAYYQNKIEEAEGYFNSVLFAYWMLSLIFSVVLMAMCLNIHHILTVPSYLVSDVQWLFAVSSLTMLVGLCTGLMGIGTYMKNRIDLSSKISLTNTVVNTLIIFGAYAFFKPSIVYVGIASLCSTVLTGFFNIRLKQKLIPELRVSPFRLYSWSKIKEVVSSGVWNSVNRLSDILLLQMDLLYVNILLGPSVVAYLALVKVVPNFILGFNGMIAGNFAPSFNILYAKGDIDRLRYEVNRSIRLIGIIVAFPIGFFTILGDRFFHLWVPTMDNVYLYHLSAFVIIPMIIGGSIIPVYGIFGVTNHLKIPALVLLVTGFVTVFVQILVLKYTTYGIFGILVVEAIQRVGRNMFFTPIYAAKCLRINRFTFMKPMSSSFVCLGFVLLVSYLYKIYIEINSYFEFGVALIVLGIISVFFGMFVSLNTSERRYVLSKVYSKVHI